MKAIRRICRALALLAALAGLVSCGPEGGTLGVAYGTRVRVQEISLVVAEDAGPQVREAARAFSEYLLQASGGALALEVRASADPRQEVSASEAAFGLLDGGKYRQFSRYFRLSADPLRYRSYGHFTMAANSARTLEFLSGEWGEGWNLEPLAAFYQGSSLILSRQPLEEYRENALEHAGVGFPVALVDGESVVLGKLGLDCVPADLTARLSLIQEGSAEAAEFGPGELEHLARWNWRGTGLTATMGYHDVSPLWLVADSSFYADLTPRNRAAVIEAYAGMYQLLDGDFLAREDEVCRRLEEMGVSLGGSLLWMREDFLEDAATPGEEHFLRLLEHIE